jgi:hypothetical protein
MTARPPDCTCHRANLVDTAELIADETGEAAKVVKFAGLKREWSGKRLAK